MAEQLIKRTGEGYSNVMPKSWIEAITDKSTGESLTHILQGFNMYFLSYTGNTEQTRCQVPKILRKKGLWVTYVKYDGNVYTEWYNSNDIDDKSWGNSSNWRIGNNELVGDLTISANGNWVINGNETEFKAIGEKGNTPLIRIANNKLQVSYDTGNTYHNVSDNPVYTQIRTYNNKLQISTDLGANWTDASDEIAAYFRFNSGQGNNVGSIQISRNNKDWNDLSGNFVNNLHISKYIGANETLPTSGIAEGTIYAKGPTYADSDTSHSNPIYRLWVYAYKGSTLAWQDNGEFTSISAGIAQELGDSENLVVSQRRVSQEIIQGGVYDVSSHNNNAVFESLQALLSSPSLSTFIPALVRHGGMSIKFIQGSVPNSDNNSSQYVQFHYIGTSTDTADFTNPANWQGVDDVPTVGSQNLLTSGGVEKAKIQLDITDSTISSATGFSKPYFGKLTIDSNAIWRNINDLDGHYIIPVKENDSIVIESRSSFQIAYFSDYDTPVVGQHASLIGDRIMGTSSGSYTAPVGAKYLYVLSVYNGSPIPVTSIKIQGIDYIEGAINHLISLIETNVQELDTKIAVINAGLYSVTTKYEDLSAALSAIPESVRKERAILYYMDNNFSIKIYAYASNNIGTEAWTTVANWKQIYTADEVTSIIVANNKMLTNQIVTTYINQLASSITTINNSISGINTDLSPISKSFNKLERYCVFNGTSSKGSITPITLSQNGDSFEFQVFPHAASSSYGLFQGSTVYNISIAVSKDKFAVRASDSNETWLVASPTSITSSDSHIIKILYVNNNIEFYVDNALLSTYTGQKPIVIKNFGYAAAVTKYWKGKLGYIIVNDKRYGSLDLLDGFQQENITVESNGFLSEEQKRGLVTENQKSMLLPNIVVNPAESKVDVYFRLNRNVYGKLGIVHTVNHTDDTGQNAYCDLWGLYDDGDTVEYDGTTFTSLGKKLLIGAENEFAFQLQGMGDYTGGYHGDERIDMGNDGCYVEFIADGKVYSISGLVSKGMFSCESFAYRQRSNLYASYAYDSGHKLLGTHDKITRFSNCGYTTRNYVKMDLTALGVSSINATTVFTGLVCPHKNYTDNAVIGDNGFIYTPTPDGGPATSVELVHYNDATSREVFMSGDDGSVVINSKIVGSNIQAFANPAPNVLIMDRKNDNKYYSYLPTTNLSLQTGDFFMTECNVIWKV